MKIEGINGIFAEMLERKLKERESAKMKENTMFRMTVGAEGGVTETETSIELSAVAGWKACYQEILEPALGELWEEKEKEITGYCGKISNAIDEMMKALPSESACEIIALSDVLSGTHKNAEMAKNILLERIQKNEIGELDILVNKYGQDITKWLKYIRETSFGQLDKADRLKLEDVLESIIEEA